MDLKKRGPGRPKNSIPSRVVPVTILEPAYELLGTIADAEGCARATWAHRALMEAIHRHRRRANRQ